MTGHSQPRQEWLDAVRSGEMTYHSIEDVAISVELDGSAPELTARTLTDATIWGDTARGIAYGQVKLVCDEDGGEVVTDSSIRYDDIYVRQNGRWLIATRISHFTINDKRDCHRQRHGGRTDV